MSTKQWYGLLVETEKYAVGAHFLDWDTELKRELDKYRITYQMVKKAGSERAAQKWVNDNAELVDLHHGSDRVRHARAQGGRCWYCGRVLNMKSSGKDDSAELEHQTPRSQTGPGSGTVTSCRKCNNPAGDGKGNRTLEEYRAYLLVKNHPGKTRLRFYGEWLEHKRAQAAQGLPANAQTFLKEGDALAFPEELLVATEDSATNKM